MRITTGDPIRSSNDRTDVAALSPADIAIHQGSTGAGRKEAPRRWTIVAAVFGHAVLLALFVIDWQSRPQPAPPPKTIPIQLVMVPPKPAPEPPAAPAAPKLESGPEQETTAPLPAEAEGPKAAPPPAAAPTVEEKLPGQPPPAQAPPERPVPIGSAKPMPKKNPIPTEAPKEAPIAMAPHVVSLSPPGRAPSEAARSGDRYLNDLRDRIERNRSYPPLEVFRSLPGAIAIYQVVVDRRGNLMGVRIVQSTGLSKLDEAAGLMIRDAAPFPPLPPQYPDVRALITIEIPIFPEPH